MRAWFAANVGTFLAMTPESVVNHLAREQAVRFSGDQSGQITAWEDSIAVLRTALADAPKDWALALEYDLLRLEKRIDAVLLTDRAILVMEFKAPDTFARQALRDTLDYAQDLFDFHAESRSHPIVPILVAGEAGLVPFAPQLIWHAVSPTPFRTGGGGLGDLIAHLVAAIPAPSQPIDSARWLAAQYRPVPSIIEAASLLYQRHSVGDIATARADTKNLAETTAAIGRAIHDARAANARVVVFVTGVPGAGKTLCGMNVVFGELRHEKAVFLTGNAPLVAVLREALARNASAHDRSTLKAARDDTKTSLQNVHKFLEDNVVAPHKVPAERIIVFDEAQRAWDEAKARRGTLRKRSILTMSEPAHTLEIMARHDGWAVVVALIGQGQEINTGEAGVTEWRRVIEATGTWRAVAAPAAASLLDPPLGFPGGAPSWLSHADDLDLAVSIRSICDASAARWVDAVLRNDPLAAQQHAQADAPQFHVTRNLDHMRAALRARVHGHRRCGLVASSGARRLRAEGLGAEIQGPDETITWFLERWPEDVRASDALETIATEYSCQGLELDYVGLAWGGDYIRDRGVWRARAFNGSDGWNTVHKTDRQAFIRNKYRVLLTRARYETIIWVPPGDASLGDDADRTRPAAEMDAIAEFLLASGARPLEALPAPSPAAPALL